MVHYFVSDDTGRSLRAVLIDVVTEVGDRSVRARYKHLGDTAERIADLAEELVLRAHGAPVLSGVMSVRTDLLRKDMLRVELQHLSCLMVRPDHGMEEAHVNGSFGGFESQVA
jgi:hypothetical protein